MEAMGMMRDLDQIRERDDRPQNPIKLEHLRDVALAKERGFRGVQSQRNERRRCFPRQLATQFCIAHRGEGVEVGDEVERLPLVLKLEELADRAVIVPEVKLSRGLDSGQNAHRGN